MKYIKNGRFILPHGIINDGVLAFDDKIFGFINENEIPENAEVINANGGYVAPGLIDIHIHGYLGEDTSDGKADGIFKIANGIMKNGVTSFCPTTMTVSDDEINKELLFLGWTVIRFWGNDIKKNTDECIKVIEETIFDLKMSDIDN